MKNTVRLNTISKRLIDAQSEAEANMLNIDDIIVYDDPINRATCLLKELRGINKFNNPRLPRQGKKKIN